MKCAGTPPMRRGYCKAHSTLVLALLALLPTAGCRHAPAAQSQPSAKNDRSQQPAAAPAGALAPFQVPPPSPHFAIQVAAFNRRADAEALAAQISEQYGLQTLVAPVEAGGATMYRVRLLVASKDEAESVADSFLRNEKLKVWIVPLP